MIEIVRPGDWGKRRDVGDESMNGQTLVGDGKQVGYGFGLAAATPNVG